MTRREEWHANEDCFPTLRAEPEVGAGECCQQIAAVGRLGQQLGAGRGQQLTAESEFSGAMAVGRRNLKDEIGEEKQSQKESYVFEGPVYGLVGICHFDERNAKRRCVEPTD